MSLAPVPCTRRRAATFVSVRRVPRVADWVNALESLYDNADLASDDNESVQAAEAAVCAGEQDKYIQYHDKLYANFGGENKGVYPTSRLKDYADDLGLDTGAFNECLDSGRYEAAVIQSMEEGRTNGITATPMFMIDNGNGQPNVVQQTSAGYDLLQKQIQAAIDTAP